MQRSPSVLYLELDRSKSGAYPKLVGSQSITQHHAHAIHKLFHNKGQFRVTGYPTGILLDETRKPGGNPQVQGEHPDSQTESQAASRTLSHTQAYFLY